MKYLIVLISLLFGLSKHLRDEIAYHSGSFEWEWLNTNRWETNSWWLKNVFTMFLDGWHFMEFLNVYSFCMVVAIIAQREYKLDRWHIVTISVGLYIVIGGLHSLLDGSLCA